MPGLVVCARQGGLTSCWMPGVLALSGKLRIAALAMQAPTIGGAQDVLEWFHPERGA